MNFSRMLARGIVAVGTLAMPFALAAGPADDDMATDTTSSSAYVSDASITAKVKAALIANAISNISITTDQGVVALSGEVQDESVRQRATEIAASVDGVRGVDYSGLSIRDKSLD